jgi:hypothetical protein
MSDVFFVKLNAQNRVIKSKVYPNTTVDAIKSPPPDMINITDQIKNKESFAKKLEKVVNKPNKDLYFINGKFHVVDRYSFDDAVKLEKLLEDDSTLVENISTN